MLEAVFQHNTLIEFNINNISILAMQGNIMTQVIKLHTAGRKLIVCRGQEGSSLYYSLSSHNRLLYYPRVHFHLKFSFNLPLKGEYQLRWAYGLLFYRQSYVFLVTIYFLSVTSNIRNLTFNILHVVTLCPTQLHRKHMSPMIFSFWLRMLFNLMSYTPKIMCWGTTNSSY